MRPLPLLLTRLDLLDQGWLERLALTGESPRLVRRAWTAVTHLGGAVATLASVLIPIALGSAPRAAGLRAAAALALSHLAVQVVKRFVSRARPSAAVPGTRLIADPDRFSFPSGHATAALVVTLAYGLARPALALPLAVLGLLIGWSRVALRVHYPGDVLAGQLIATITVLALS